MDNQKVELPVVAWASPHDRMFRDDWETTTPRLFRERNADFFDVGLTTVAHAESYARAMVEELHSAWCRLDEAVRAHRQCSLYPEEYSEEEEDEIGSELDAATNHLNALLAKLGEKGNGNGQ